jgi:glycosyltransferase involved in cell wall biosynthesis
MDLIRAHPPDGVSYTSTGDFHTGAPGARSAAVWERGLNQLVRPRAVPDMGFRAFRVNGDFQLVHVHAHPVHLSGLGERALVMSEGSSNAVYLGDYLGWDDERIGAAYARTRRAYRALRIHDRLLALDRVDRAYVFSDWARALNVRWGADESKLDVVPPGFPTPDPVDREGRSTFTFLFVGTDFERKGGFDVIEAFDRVARELEHVRLVVAGSDPWTPNPDRLIHSWVGDERRRRVLALFEELRAGGRIEHLPLVPAGTVRESLYPAADAFVMPTLAEGFGFTNVEAMSFALPVISSTVGPIPEVIVDGQTGVLVAPGDIDGLAAAMGSLAADPGRAATMGQAGREAFHSRFTIDDFRARLAQVYRRALAR